MQHELIETYLYHIITAVICVSLFISFYLVRRNRKNIYRRFLAEGELFRERLLYELEGVYPIPRNIDPVTCERFKKSIPGIETAADEFRPSLPPEKRKEFDAALKKHVTHCRRINWGACVAFKIKPGERKPEDEGPKEIFRQNVIKLLSFTKGSD